MKAMKQSPTLINYLEMEVKFTKYMMIYKIIFKGTESVLRTHLGTPPHMWSMQVQKSRN